jgi:mRNA interferase MazF
MTSSEAPEPWEVWHARFDFSEGKGYKYRPVIVIDIAEDGSIVMMVTSATNRLHLVHDYLISDWKGAGLEKPSIARADRIAHIPAGYLGTAGRIGRYGDTDKKLDQIRSNFLSVSPLYLSVVWGCAAR